MLPSRLCGSLPADPSLRSHPLTWWSSGSQVRRGDHDVGDPSATVGETWIRVLPEGHDARWPQTMLPLEVLDTLKAGDAGERRSRRAAPDAPEPAALVPTGERRALCSAPPVGLLPIVPGRRTYRVAVRGRGAYPAHPPEGGDQPSGPGPARLRSLERPATDLSSTEVLRGNPSARGDRRG